MIDESQQYHILSKIEEKWDRLGNGCFGAAYCDPDNPDWILKIGQNDGTRNYLEWCKFYQDRGERMPGMPEIDFLTDWNANQYMVGMKRYQCARDRIVNKGVAKYATHIHLDRNMPEYLRALVMMWEHESQLRANDVHSGNIMWSPDKKEFILTDPSSRGYEPIGYRNQWRPFQLTAPLAQRR